MKLSKELLIPIRRNSYQPLSNERMEFENDAMSITSSEAFRRLQGKTQVYTMEENDYVRNRLTHSMEVACIGHHLGVRYVQLRQELTNIPSILYSAGLLHDIGNPPFGHYGERIINEFFLSLKDRNDYEMYGVVDAFNRLSLVDQIEFQHFDGNAQGFRIAVSIGESDKKEIMGMNLSFPLLATIVKYPRSAAELVDDKKKKLGFFKPEVQFFTQLSENLQLVEGERYPLTYLLEAADDIAYCVSDIQDAMEMDESYKKIFIDTVKQEFGWGNALIDKLTLQGVCVMLKENLIGHCIDNLKMIEQGNEHSLLHKRLDGLRKITSEIYDNPKIIKRELAGGQVLFTLLETFTQALFCPNILKSRNDRLLKLIPEYLYKGNHLVRKDGKVCLTGETELEEDYCKFRLVVDFVSSMTDNYALTLYRDLQCVNLAIG